MGGWRSAGVNGRLAATVCHQPVLAFMPPGVQSWSGLVQVQKHPGTILRNTFHSRVNQLVAITIG